MRRKPEPGSTQRATSSTWTEPLTLASPTQVNAGLNRVPDAPRGQANLGLGRAETWRRHVSRPGAERMRPASSVGSWCSNEVREQWAR
jgi:hypothetical protein